MIELMQKAFPVLIDGFWITLRIGLFSIVFASLLGLGSALMRSANNRLVAGIAFLYSTIFRGTPLLIQLFLLYYGIGTLGFVHDQSWLWWLFSDGARCAILAISLNSGAYMGEAIRGGLQSVASGQIDAALS
ncbi:MAG: ABC transporter permease subunit, partial [Castellaniella sp.]